MVGGSAGAHRQRAVDVTLAAATFVVVGTAITADVGSSSVGLGAYVFAALFAAAMLVRRRWPVATLVASAAALPVYYMLGYPPIGLALPLAAALFSTAERGRPRWAIGVAVALLAVSTGTRLLDGDDPAFVLGLELPTSVALMTAMIALGDGVRARRGWRAETAERARAAAAERERLLAARLEQERLRVARDLHDTLAHTVSVIALHTDVAREAIHDDPDTAQRCLTAARAACRDAGRELRATVAALRADSTTEPPAPELDRLSELIEAAEAAGLTVTLDGDTDTATLPTIVGLTAYRVVQESLSNVLRHAAATTVLIEIDRTGTRLRVRVSDDGTGADSVGIAGGGWGITGMRERVTLLGGSLDTGPGPTGGFVVDARIPLRDPA
ncbi:sensor histidine kinase [Nocardia halotolerans]|uniref:histidine kinase n=1 Tax=Nocardia halotolerans TaxID=1755878 RepID=A0ABV8VCE4_9NOCA